MIEYTAFLVLTWTLRLELTHRPGRWLGCWWLSECWRMGRLTP